MPLKYFSDKYVAYVIKVKLKYVVSILIPSLLGLESSIHTVAAIKINISHEISLFIFPFVINRIIGIDNIRALG